MDDETTEYTLDTDRGRRCGFPEVIFASGKTPEQVAGIAVTLYRRNGVVLATRATPEQAAATAEALPESIYLPRSGVLLADRREQGIRLPPAPTKTEGDLVAALLQGGEGSTVVCCAGTSDLPVAEEAALTARLMGSAVHLIADIGVAGVHRVLACEGTLREARAIAVVAGMEGALPSVVAGLVDVPVIAVPTSIGYGASFGGLAALLGMLNSCAGGVSVVNIDNGFGAGQIVDRINRPRH